MVQNNTAKISLPIPLKQETDPTTNVKRLVNDTLYYQMRLHDVRVYLLDANGKPLGTAGTPVQLSITKAGSSSFFNNDMSLTVFSHQPVRYGAGMFVYDPVTGCPETQSYCGNLCPDFIRYSPFGQWNVEIFSPEKQKVNMSNLVSLRFEFQIDYKHFDGFNPSFFGKSPELYPQNFGKLCASKEQTGNLNKTS